MKTLAKKALAIVGSGIVLPLIIFAVLKGANDSFFQPPIHISNSTFLISYVVLAIGAMIFAAYQMKN
jgi:hypothetical protein